MTIKNYEKYISIFIANSGALLQKESILLEMCFSLFRSNFASKIISSHQSYNKCVGILTIKNGNEINYRHSMF